jgi:hypothetical protein
MIKHVAFGSIVAALGCWIGAPEAKAEPIVFIVSYHNVDYAKTVCDYVSSMQKSGFGLLNDESIAGLAECKSVRDTRDLGRRLENALIDALAVEPLCNGVTVIRDRHPDHDGGGFSQENYAIKQSKPHWDLHLDYQPGSKAFGWTLYPNKAGMKPDGAFVNGEGTAPKAARQICIVASGHGATIR